LAQKLDVVALGGNAILPIGKTGTIREQVAITTSAMEQIADLLDSGRNVVLTHGNGPIVGNIVIRNEAVKDQIPPMPLDVCGADSQGGIGYMIQQTMKNTLRARGVDRDVVSLVTQVLVDENDPAFDKPVKPIGPYYSQADAKRIEKERGWVIVKDSNRGFRRVVPSPKPVRIVERDVIVRLVDAGTIVVTVGGGGIPVVSIHDRYEGREAVIDKDLASALLARELRAERLIILTSVDAVYTNYGTPQAEPLNRVSLADLRKLAGEGHFAPGSMGAKLDAVAEFLENGGATAVICLPQDLTEAAAGRRGTTIHK
jgi:carbamate kinase